MAVNIQESAAESKLYQGLQILEVSRPEKVATALMCYALLILEANRRTNLVGARSIEELVTAHFLDSLAPLAGVSLSNPVVDVGSGAGLPGIVVAIARPAQDVVCLEPRSKRAAFLRHAVAQLNLDNVQVVKMTAESAGRKVWRERAGTALARALASPVTAAGLGLPLLRVGGRLFLYMGRRRAPSAREADSFKRLRGEMDEAREVFVPHLEAQRHVWVVRKVRALERTSNQLDEGRFRKGPLESCCARRSKSAHWGRRKRCLSATISRHTAYDAALVPRSG